MFAVFIAYFNSFLTPFLLLLESTCHLRRLKNDFKKRASFVDDRQVRWQVFCMSPALPLTHLLSLLISYLQNLLYMHNTHAFFISHKNWNFHHIGFEPRTYSIKDQVGRIFKKCGFECWIPFLPIFMGWISKNSFSSFRAIFTTFDKLFLAW